MIESKTNSVLAFRLFFLYFILEILLKIVFTSISDIGEQEPSYALNMFFLICHTVLLFILVLRFNKKNNVIIQKDFSFYKRDLLPAILIGISLGVFIPLIGNLGYFFKDTFFFDVTLNSIKEMGEISANYTVIQFYSLTFISTIGFTIARELFFRGALLKLFRKDLKITVATLQVSFLFTLMYLSYQYNQVDILSPLIINVILCYIVFLTKSLVPSILIAITNDIPFLYLVHNSSFIENPEKYLVFNFDHILYYFLFLLLLYAGFSQLIKTERPDYES